MAIDTINEQFSLLSFGSTLMPQVVVSPSTLGMDDQQHLLWGYPGILWSVLASLGFTLDMNTRIMQYLRSQYSVTGGDLPTLINRDLAGRTGDYTARMKALMADATAAM
jgi:hypothetical protein